MTETLSSRTADIVTMDGEAVVIHFLRLLRTKTPLTDTALHKFASSLFVLSEVLRGRQRQGQRRGGVGVDLIVCTERDLYYRSPRLFGQAGQRGVQSALARLVLWLSSAAHDRVMGHAPADADTQGAEQTPQRWFTPRAAASAESPSLRATPYTRELLGVVAVAKARLVGRLVILHGTPGHALSSTSVWELGRRGGVPVSWQLMCSAGVHYDFDSPSLAATTTDDVVGPLSPLECTLRDALRVVPVPETVCAGSPRAVVVVEKECVLHTLLSGPLGPLLVDTCLVLCTRGYPCVASRGVLQRLHARWPRVPLLQLVDGDPHGLSILLVTLGVTLTDPDKARSGTAVARSADCLPITWVALRPSSMRSSKRTREMTAVPLSASDVTLLARLARVVESALSCEREMNSPSLVAQCLRAVQEEIQFMMQSRVKYELEAAQCV